MSTKIQWTDETWNPTTGCTKVSPGCANCYIERTPAFRIAGRKFDRQAHIPLRLHADRLETPLHWKKPRRVFVNSLSDLFHDDVPDDFLHRVYHVMEQAHRHTFQVLTKRPARMREYLSWRYGPREDGGGFRIPSRHIWHGVSVENQHFAGERIPLLLQTRTAVRFISAEPLLEAVSLRWLSAWPGSSRGAALNPDAAVTNELDGLRHLDWVIVGGESGPGARPFDIAWARTIVAQCQAAGVPVFVKQLGAWPFNGGASPDDITRTEIEYRDKKGGDPAEWPADLRVREYPSVAMLHALGDV